MGDEKPAPREQLWEDFNKSLTHDRGRPEGDPPSGRVTSQTSQQDNQNTSQTQTTSQNDD
jgi:hypothetical protein